MHSGQTATQDGRALAGRFGALRATASVLMRRPLTEFVLEPLEARAESRPR